MSIYDADGNDNQPLIGNDFKLLYGNPDKVKEATDKSKFLFGEPTERKELKGITMTELVAGTCDFTAGNTCQAQSKHGIESQYFTTEKFRYNWKVISGEVYIESGQDEQECFVKSYASGVSEVFTLQCTVINDFQSQVLLSNIYAHSKTEV